MELHTWGFIARLIEVYELREGHGRLSEQPRRRFGQDGDYRESGRHEFVIEHRPLSPKVTNALGISTRNRLESGAMAMDNRLKGDGQSAFWQEKAPNLRRHGKAKKPRRLECR
jgi:hypothetical protein